MDSFTTLRTELESCGIFLTQDAIDPVYDGEDRREFLFSYTYGPARRLNLRAVMNTLGAIRQLQLVDFPGYALTGLSLKRAEGICTSLKHTPGYLGRLPIMRDTNGVLVHAREESPGWKPALAKRGIGLQDGVPYREPLPCADESTPFEVILASGEKRRAWLDLSTQYRAEDVKWKVKDVGTVERDLVVAWRRVMESELAKEQVRETVNA